MKKLGFIKRRREEEPLYRGHSPVSYWARVYQVGTRLFYLESCWTRGWFRNVWPLCGSWKPRIMWRMIRRPIVIRELKSI